MIRQSSSEIFSSIVNTMETKNINQIGSYSLMNRTDCKYVLNSKQAKQVFNSVKSKYFVLEVNSQRIQNYKSTYFDTEKKIFYHQHHNRKNNRSKIRFREYVDSDLIFFESKTKSKGRTKKIRKIVDCAAKKLNEDHYSFVRNNTNITNKLINCHQNTFSRITLFAKESKERITIDFNVKFYDENNTIELGNIIIVEVKQPRIDYNSYMLRSLKYYKIYPFRLSKYCIGTILIDKKIKHNRFKKKILKINKLKKIDNVLN